MLKTAYPGSILVCQGFSRLTAFYSPLLLSQSLSLWLEVTVSSLAHWFLNFNTLFKNFSSASPHLCSEELHWRTGSPSLASLERSTNPPVSAMHWAALSLNNPRQCTEKHWAALSNVPIVLSLRCHSRCHRTFHRLVRATICEMFQFTSTVATGTLPYCTSLLNTLMLLPVYEDLDLTVLPPDLSHRLQSQLLDARSLTSCFTATDLSEAFKSTESSMTWQGNPSIIQLFHRKNLDLTVGCQNSSARP